MKSARTVRLAAAALVIGVTVLGLAMVVSAQPAGAPTAAALKIQQLQEDQAAIASRAQGPRYTASEKPGDDPAAAVNTPSKPRIVWSEPCPADQSACERQAPPIPATAMGVRVTNYFVGGSVDVFAAESLTTPGTGLLMVGGKTYTLPAGRGIPRLTAVAGNVVSFVTSTNAAGTFDLSLGVLSFTR